MPTSPEEVGTTAPPTPDAKNLQEDLVKIAEENGTIAPEAASAPGSVTTPETATPEPGKFEARGAAAGSKVDALVDRGSNAVAAGKEKVGEKVDSAALKAYELAGRVDNRIQSAKERAVNVRERVRNGAETGAEKMRESVKAARAKSGEVARIAFGVSVAAGEALAEAPEKIKNRGRKIADRLNKWCAKAKESFSGMKDNVKDRVSEGIGKVVVETVERIDAAGQSWEARLQEARKVAEAAAKEAELKSYQESYVKLKTDSIAEQAKVTRITEVDEATKVALRKEADTNSNAEADARKETDGKSLDDLKEMMKSIGTETGTAENGSDVGVTVEKLTGVVSDASEPAQLKPVRPVSVPTTSGVEAA